MRENFSILKYLKIKNPILKYEISLEQKFSILKYLKNKKSNIKISEKFFPILKYAKKICNISLQKN